MPLADAEGAEFVCDVVIAQTADETAFGVELALYFSDDAITLENELHAAFAARRLNHANSRKEFFFATPEEVRDVFAEKVGNLLEYAARPEAEQYYQSVSSWPAAAAGRPGG